MPSSQPRRAEALVCRLPAETRIKIIGLGGVGSIVLEFLALFLRSLQQPCRLVLIDGDEYELANAQRMKFSALGRKAEVKAAELATLLEASSVSVAAVPEYVGPGNLSRLVGNGDVVFLCVDNHPTRRLVSEYCERLQRVTLFSGGNDGVEPPDRRGTYGNAQAFVREADTNATPPLTQLHPEIRNATGALPEDRIAVNWRSPVLKSCLPISQPPATCSTCSSRGRAQSCSILSCSLTFWRAAPCPCRHSRTADARLVERGSLDPESTAARTAPIPTRLQRRDPPGYRRGLDVPQRLP